MSDDAVEPKPDWAAWGDFKLPRPLEHNFCPTCGGALIIAHDGQSDRPHCAPCNRFFYRNPIPAACCFVRRADGGLLFARRAVQPCFGMWTLPGGFIELNETAEEAALRELHEETQLRGSRVSLIGVSTRQSPMSGAILLVGYLIEDWEGEEDMRPATDASELRFFLPHERPEVPFATHRELLKKYDERFPNG
jgi:8-oxo-dGTP diphosphatase